MIEETIKDLEKTFERILEGLKKDLTRIRTGRANLALLDGIKIDYYGQPTPLAHIATLSIPQPSTIAIRPFEKRLIPAIEKAIQASDIGLTPMNDGEVIRLNIPKLTTERRRELVKTIKKKGEEAKISLRNARREKKSKLEKAIKGEGLPEDDVRRAIDKITKLTDEAVKKVDEIIAAKEKEIMEV